MEHGVFIEKGISDWQIVQQRNGAATINFSGTWIVIKDAVKIGIVKVAPLIRVLSEEDNSQIIPWQDTASEPAEDSVTGSWSATLTLPAGGLYRIETGLRVTSVRPGLIWTFRGDTRLHVGVGDVFVIAGQSNAAGTGKDTAYDPPELGVHLFRNRHKWDLAAHPFNESTEGASAPNAERGVSGTSPYLSFGKQLKKISHYPVGLISTAMGGMPIKRWNPESGPLYQNMLEQTRTSGGIAGVLWYQGCSNACDADVQNYKDKFYDVIQSFRRDLGYPVKFFVFQLNREVNSPYDSGYGTIREIQRQAAHDLQDVYVLPTLHCSLSDAIHNNSHSNIMLGEHLARQCGHVLYHSPEFYAPEITDAVLQDETVLTLAFSNMRLGFIMPSNKEENCGFTVQDEQGTIGYNEIIPDPEKPNQIIMHLSRCPVGACTVSFAWEADPARVLLLDEVTYLPPLSFYQYPIKRLN